MIRELHCGGDRTVSSDVRDQAMHRLTDTAV
jgi:hypothetical protein